MPETVSACVIAQDEEARLEQCLQSVAFCDETILVDGGSRDASVTIARRAGAHVIENPWPGFSAQRNVAIEAATGDWILEIDADERISAGLRREIESFLWAPPRDIAVGACPRRETFLGRPLGPSAKYPSFRYRLFRRSAYRHDESRTVHEGLWARERVWAFTAPLDHVFAESWREALVDMWSYAALEARQNPGRVAPRAAAFGIALRPPAKFVYRLIVDGGWRDGWRGWANIALECLGDVLVWSRRTVANLTSGAPSADVRHFSMAPAIGQVRIVAVAGDHDSVERALAWLRAAAQAGADTALVTDVASAADGLVRVQRLARLGTLDLIRALDFEDQLRPYDAVLPAGRRARRLMLLVPGRLRGSLVLAGLDVEPGAAVEHMRRETRAEEAARGPDSSA